MASIVESSDDAIVSKNLDGIIANWNRGAERIFGYTSDEAIGQPITIVIPTDRQSEERKILMRIRRGERIDHFETVRQRKDGSLVVVSLTVSPVRNAEGQIVGASKIARDITERNETTSKLRPWLGKQSTAVRTCSRQYRQL
ncbi:MAG: PAS domain S-box protein [Pseudolabrys sp.]